MDGAFWNDLAPCMLPLGLLGSLLLALIDARQDAEAGVPPGFYP